MSNPDKMKHRAETGRTSYEWLRGSARYHRLVRENPVMAAHFDKAADELRDAHVARIVAQNPGIDEAEVLASFERTGGVVTDDG